jgi:hypothetical protein
VLGSEPRGAAPVGVVEDSRDGAVGVICEAVVVVDPDAVAPAGTATESPTEAMAAAILDDFTGHENVDERAISHRPDELPRILHAFHLEFSRRYRAGANEGSDF